MVNRRLPHRVLRHVAIAVGAVLALVVVIVAGLLVYIDTYPGRRFVAAEVTRRLAPLFQGQVRVDGVGGLGLFGLSGGDVTIYDPKGRPVITAHGVRVRIATWTALKSALFGRDAPIAIALSEVSVEALDIRLDTDDAGHLDLVDAFTPRNPGGPADPKARGVRLTIQGIAVRHGVARGTMRGAPALDVDLDGVAGAFKYAPDGVDIDVFKAAVTGHKFVNGVDLTGALAGHGEMPSIAGKAPTARVSWTGALGGVAHSVSGSLDRGNLEAVVDVPEVRPDLLRSIWPESPVDATGSAHAEVRGVLPRLAVDLRAALGGATFAANGTVVVDATKEAKLTIDARNVDVHEWATSAPASRLGVNGTVEASQTDSGPFAAKVDLHWLAGSVGSTAVPAGSIRGHAEGPDAATVTAHATVDVDEPGAPIHIALDLAPTKGGPSLRFGVDSTISRIEGIPELHGAVSGVGHVSSEGVVDLRLMRVDARLSASAGRLVMSGNRVETMSAEVHAAGPIANPNVDLALRATGVIAGGFRYASADVDVRGAARTPHITVAARGLDAPDVDASGDVRLEGGLTLRQARVALARAGERAVVSAVLVSINGHAVRVDSARVDGLGELATLSFASTRSSLHVRGASRGIDLGRVSRLVHREGQLKSGTLAFEADVDVAPPHTHGRGFIDLTNVLLGDGPALAAHVELALDGRHVVGKAHAQAGDVGTVDIDAPGLSLGGSGPLSATSWKTAWGQVTVDGRVDLAKAAAFVPSDKLPFAEISGEVTVKGHVGRDDLADLTPDLTLAVTTAHLTLASKTRRWRDIDGVIVYEHPLWRLSGIDFNVQGTLDGDTGLLDLLTEARDAKGALATLHGTVPHFPSADILLNNGQLATDARVTPFDVRLTVPSRRLGGLPAILKQNYLTGKLQGDVHAMGTLTHPTVDMHATLEEPYATGEARPVPLDLDLTAHYDGLKGAVSLTGRSAGRSLLEADAHVDAAVTQFIDWIDAPLVWSASARAHLDGYPLDAITVLSDKLVAGQVSGDFALEDLHKDARLSATLSVDSLRVGSIAYKGASLKASVDGHALDAVLRIDQTDGFAEAKAHAATMWRAELTPALEPAQPLDADLVSKNFRIAVLLPFVEGTLDELDGRIDANTHVELDPRAGASARLSGEVVLSRGTVEAAAGGGEFHDIAAKLRFSPDGVITLDRLTASGLTGRLEATAAARMDGAALVTARGTVLIPHDAPIPLTAGGTEVGDVDGRMDISASTSEGGRATEIKVDVPRLHVALPGSSSSSVQALEPMANGVHIGAHRGSTLTFLIVPLDPVRPPAPPSKAPATHTSIDINLMDGEIVRGRQLKIDLDGSIHVKSGTPAEVTGQIRLRQGGIISVYGKNFAVDSGTVTLVGLDPSNPEVVVRAGWTAPDATVVYANFVGPLKTGKVTLISEPPLPQQEIVQLLLFGTTDGQQAQQGGGASANSVGASVGGQAAEPLNHALNQVGLGAVTTNIDTSNSANPKPEVEVQIARDISIQLAVVLGNISPGVNPDSELLTVDWRFLSRWSLASTFGTAGTTVFDLLWQKRY